MEYSKMNYKTRKLILVLLPAVFTAYVLYVYMPFQKTVNTKKLLEASIDLLEEAGKRIVEIRRSPSINARTKFVGKDGKAASELLTAADTTSHKVIKQGLTSMFPGLKIISEEHVQDDDVMVYLPNPDRIQLTELSDGDEIPLSEISVWIDPLDATQEYSENLTEYVTIMMCVVRHKEPVIGIIYKPFEGKLYWAYQIYEWKKTSGLSRYSPKEESRKPRIIVSRSHAGDVKDTVNKKFGEQFEILPAGGSGFKAIEVIEGRADVYLHTTSIKKWDTCAPDALLHISGMRMTDLNGLPIEYSRSEDFLNGNGLMASRGEIPNKYNHFSFLKALKSDNQK